jgi:hypothetical protein
LFHDCSRSSSASGMSMRLSHDETAASGAAP